MSQSDALIEARNSLEQAKRDIGREQRFPTAVEDLAFAQTQALIAIAEALIEPSPRFDEECDNPDCDCHDEPVPVPDDGDWECGDPDCACQCDESNPEPVPVPDLGPITFTPHIGRIITRILFLHPREWV